MYPKMANGDYWDTYWKLGYIINPYWLVLWNMNFMTFHMLGIVIPTDFHIFQRG